MRRGNAGKGTGARWHEGQGGTSLGWLDSAPLGSLPSKARAVRRRQQLARLCLAFAIGAMF